MRIFKTRTFQRWASKTGVSDIALLDAVAEMECGLIDADLGGNLYKKRVALPGRGKSGSTRTIIATQFAGVLFFLYGFEKNDRNFRGKPRGSARGSSEQAGTACCFPHRIAYDSYCEYQHQNPSTAYQRQARQSAASDGA
jgi:hypothetical protein